MNPYPSPLPEQIFASATQQMSQIRKRSPRKRNFDANHEVDSPIILKALIEGFMGRRIFVEGGSSSEVMYEHCFRNLRAETKAKLKESRTYVVGGIFLKSRWKTEKAGEPDGTIQPLPSPPKKDTQTDEKVEGKDEQIERPLESKPPEKVVIHDDHLDQTITIGGNLSVKCRSELIEILWKHADTFAWTRADMTRIPRCIAEHELKTYPHIEPRVRRKRSIDLNRRKVVKDEVAEWLKAGIVRKNDGATFQRLVDTIFEGQMGRNLEAYVDDMVIKSKTEPEIIKDVEETLLTLKKVNMKLNPKKYSFEMEEGKFLGYIVTSEGIRANPEKAKAVQQKRLYPA
ncbi:reverse transcriptase domain-containing protein [Tanacetum coccineum]